jgi:hypothetical protein
VERLEVPRPGGGERSLESSFAGEELADLAALSFICDHENEKNNLERF